MNNKKFIYKKGIIENWDEGLPLGNGKIGCLVYGKNSLVFSIDRSDLWDKRVPPETLESGFNYQNQIFTANNNWEEHQRLFDSCYLHPYPTKISAGRIAFFDCVDEDSIFSLDLNSAEVKVETRKGHFTAFLCFDRNIGIIKYPKKIKWNIETPDYLCGKGNGLGYPETEYKREGSYICTVQRTKTDFCFGFAVKEINNEDNGILIFTIWSGNDAEYSLRKAIEELEICESIGADALFGEQKLYWKDYYSKSSLKVGDDEFDGYYLKAKYLFASASREGCLPMPLQGLWTADNDELPPWKGDYHADLNMQMCYEAYLKAGSFREGRVLCDYLWGNRDTYRNFTKKFFNVKGLLVPGVSATDGTPLGGWPMYALNPCVSIWLSKCFDEYYKYTQDEEFLTSVAYPFLSEEGEAVSSLLILENGYLRLPLTVSPEYNDGRREAYLPDQSNFELSLLKWLFSVLKKYSEKFGLSDAVKKYEGILGKLKGYALDENGVLKICESAEYTFSHRHFSHLLSVCPLHEFDPLKDGEFIFKNIAKLEECGTNLWIGFSFVAMAELCAYIGEGNRAYRYLRDYIEGFTAENGFHLNGDYKNYGYSSLHYRPFTIEAVFGFAKALQEMVLGDTSGVITLFPAIPEKWKNNKISFKNFVCENGIKISADYERGRVYNVTLYSEKNRVVGLRNGITGTILSVTLKAGRRLRVNLI